MTTQIRPEKAAKNDSQILDVIANRWSPRSFADKKVSEKTLMSLFEAARWAASSMNEQPWRFIYAFKGSEAHNNIVATLMEGNKPWAKDAPVLLLTIIKKNYTRSGSTNTAAHHDLGLAIGNLSIQATFEGVGLHQMGGFSAAKAKEIFNIPNEYEAVTAIALGYFGDPNQLSEPFKSRELAERNRMKVEDFAFESTFNS